MSPRRLDRPQAAGSQTEIKEVAADKGYHGAGTLELCTALGWRTYIPEPRRKQRSRWTDKPAAYRTAVYANRRRVRGAHSKRLQRLRSELTERSFAHVCETGGARRTWLRGLDQVRKRYLIQVAARNLGLILRKLFGIGTPPTPYEQLIGIIPTNIFEALSKGDMLAIIFVAILTIGLLGLFFDQLFKLVRRLVVPWATVR